MPVKRRKLGRTGVEVSEIGFGGFPMGGSGPGWAYGATDDRTSKRALEVALDRGCNLFDVADCYGYGRSERLLGDVLQSHHADVVVATKVGFDFYGGVPYPNFHPKYLRFAVHQSLRRLRLDCIDLCQLHNPPLAAIRSPEVHELLHGLRVAGKVRWLGVSAATVSDGIAAIEAGWVDVVQVPFNLLSCEAEIELFPLAYRHGVAILVREALANGILSGKYDADSQFPYGDIRGLWPASTLAQVCQQVEGIRPFCREGESLVELALRFVLERKCVSSVLVGAKTPAQVHQNLRASRASQPQFI